MKEEIRKIIYNNCGIQDGATLVEYIEELQARIDKAILFIRKLDVESEELFGLSKIARLELYGILQGSDKE